MKFFKSINLAIAAACAVTFAACSDSDDNGGISEGNGESEQLTPTKTKEYLDDAAQELVTVFNAADQKELIELGSYFEANFADLEFPSFDSKNKSTVKAFMSTLKKGVANLSASTISRAAQNFVYSLDFSQLAGVYEPGNYEWERTADSNDIIFRFKNAKGETCELKAVASKDANEQIEWSVEDEDWYYDEDNDNYHYEEFTNTYKVTIPKTVTVRLTDGGKQLANIKTTTSISLKGHTVAADVDAAIMNITAKATASGNDKNVNEFAELTVDNRTIFISQAYLNGNNLCNVDAWNQASEDADENDEDIDITKFLSNAGAMVDVFGKVQVYSKVPEFTNEMAAAIDGYWDGYDYDSKAEALADATKAATLLSSQVSTSIKFDGTATEQAHIIFEPTLEDWGSEWGNEHGWEYTLQPMLFFPADNTTYTVEKYMQKGFNGVIDAVDDLIESYAKIWNK